MYWDDGFLKWDQMHDSLKNDMNFCRSLLDPDPNNLQDETTFKSVFERAGISVSFSWERSEKTICKIFEFHPFLSHDREVWETFINYYDKNQSFKSTIRHLVKDEHQPADQDLMERLCRKDLCQLEEMDQVIFSNLMRTKNMDDSRNIIRVNCLEFVDDDPDFVVEHLSALRFCEEDADIYFDVLSDLGQSIRSDLWRNREDLTEAWFDAGLPLLREGLHPEEWNSDPDRLFPIGRKAATRNWRMLAIGDALEELMRDVNFITQAMQLDPAIFQYPSDALHEENFEIAIWALGDRHPMRSTHSLLHRGKCRNCSIELSKSWLSITPLSILSCVRCLAAGRPLACCTVSPY
eukprot:scaffold3632_cov162-Amphora_coffeaeformis.AAC.7